MSENKKLDILYGCCRVCGEWWYCPEIDRFVKLCMQHKEEFLKTHKHWRLVEVTSDQYLQEVAMKNNGKPL